MKSAKEMFEELGYKHKQENIENNIIYILEEDSEYKKEIYFYVNDKIIDFDYGFDEGYGFIDCTFPLSLKELQAINQQVEELHWNDTTVNIDVKLDGKKVMEAMKGGNNDI